MSLLGRTQIWWPLNARLCQPYSIPEGDESAPKSGCYTECYWLFSFLYNCRCLWQEEQWLISLSLWLASTQMDPVGCFFPRPLTDVVTLGGSKGYVSEMEKWIHLYLFSISSFKQPDSSLSHMLLGCLKARFFLYHMTSLPQSAYILQGVKHMYPKWENLCTPNYHKHGECLQVPFGGCRPLQLKLMHPLSPVWWIHTSCCEGSIINGS